MLKITSILFLSLLIPNQELLAERRKDQKWGARVAISGMLAGSLSAAGGAASLFGYESAVTYRDGSVDSNLVYRSRQVEKLSLPLSPDETHVNLYDGDHRIEQVKTRIGRVFDRFGAGQRWGTPAFGIRLQSDYYEMDGERLSSRRFIVGTDRLNDSRITMGTGLKEVVNWAKNTWPKPELMSARRYVSAAQVGWKIQDFYKATLFIDRIEPVPSAINTVAMMAGTLIALGSAAYFYYSRSRER
ncbi:MAG: hypothetical protein HY401_06055 [Elusimicrobia bacterium]|nr:hypothetical protein [Elusimicrobiota bacterium]